MWLDLRIVWAFTIGRLVSMPCMLETVHDGRRKPFDRLLKRLRSGFVLPLVSFKRFDIASNAAWLVMPMDKNTCHTNRYA